MAETIDFGAPAQFGMHHLYVEVPPGARDAIRIFEDYGFDGDDTHWETTVCRVTLARELWTQIRDDARRDFNTRLKSKKRSTGSWTVGKVLLDRFLGRELCVLAWAAELASPDQCAVICQKWLALRPEERWWLYSKTASEAGLEDQAAEGGERPFIAPCPMEPMSGWPRKRNPSEEKKNPQKSLNPLYSILRKTEIYNGPASL